MPDGPPARNCLNPPQRLDTTRRALGTPGDEMVRFSILDSSDLLEPLEAEPGHGRYRPRTDATGPNLTGSCPDRQGPATDRRVTAFLRRALTRRNGADPGRPGISS